MATMQGITGKLSGKMGSAVFRVRNGQQVVTQYNPIVANPNTKAQQGPRSKFKLLSQLAAVLSPGFGTLNVVRRPAKGVPSKRNAFMKINYPLTTNETRGDEEVAEIPMAQIKLTSSSRYLGEIAIADGSVDVTEIPEEVTSVRFVIVTYKNDEPVLSSVEDVTVTDNAASLDLENVSAKQTILAYGIIPQEGASDSSYDSVSSITASIPFKSAVELDEMVKAGTIVETQTIGVDYNPGA